jgi:bifunctional aspartokinase / homoserine dehydrogenase 1
MKVLKFGGSSLATTSRIRGVAEIVREEARGKPLVMVVSAFQGVTNQLLECASLAARSDPNYVAAFQKIVRRHRSAIDDLLGKRRAARIRAQVDILLGELREVLHGIQLLGHSPPRALDLVASFGERLSAVIAAAHLNRSHRATFVDARRFIVTDDQFTNANVIFGKTNRAIRRFFLTCSEPPGQLRW